MGKWNFSLGHLEGSSKQPKLISQGLETSGTGLLLLLGNLLAVGAALAALFVSIFDRKPKA